MSLHSKVETAAINIERDITKCVTCHWVLYNKSHRNELMQVLNLLRSIIILEN